MLHFANTTALALGILLPLLILAYLRRPSSSRRIVPSLFLLKLLPPPPVSRRRIKLPPRFFVELLTLLLLLLAAAAPSIERQDRSLAIVIDTSLSMRVRSADPEDRSSRFTAAVARAKSFVESHSSGARFTLFGTAPALNQIGPARADRGSALQLLDSLSASFSGDDLGSALSELADDTRFDQIYVISDRSFEYTPGSGALFSAEQVGSPVRNIFIADAHISAESSPQVIVAVGLSGESPQHGSVQLSQLDEGGGKKPLSSLPVRVTRDRTTELRFHVRPQANYHLALRAEETRRGMNDDSLAEDNEVWLTSSPGASTPLLLVTASSGGDPSLGLSQLNGFSFVTKTPAQFGALTEREQLTFGGIIFHHTAPTVLSGSPSLFILPPLDNPIFPGAEEISEPRLSSWASEHAIMSYLRPALLKTSRALTFHPPPWAQSIINAEQGPVVIAGERAGTRHIASGVELLPFEGKRTPLTSILTINMLRWLRGGEEIGPRVTGSRLRLEPGYRWTLQAPDGQSLLRDGSEPSLLTLDLPGIYTASGEPLDPRDAPVRRTVAVNPFHGDESQTFIQGVYQLPGSAARSSLAREDIREVWWPLILGTTVLLLADLLIMSRYGNRPRQVYS